MVCDCEREIELADRAVALNPNSCLAWNSRGWVHRNAGLLEEALRSFERSIRMSPVDPDLYRSFAGIGYAFIELGRFEEAIVAGKKAQHQKPSFAATVAAAALGRSKSAVDNRLRVLRASSPVRKESVLDQE
jgi:adenylate cyclase